MSNNACYDTSVQNMVAKGAPLATRFRFGGISFQKNVF